MGISRSWNGDTRYHIFGRMLWGYSLIFLPSQIGFTYGTSNESVPEMAIDVMNSQVLGIPGGKHKQIWNVVENPNIKRKEHHLLQWWRIHIYVGMLYHLFRFFPSSKMSFASQILVRCFAWIHPTNRKTKHIHARSTGGHLQSFLSVSMDVRLNTYGALGSWVINIETYQLLWCAKHGIRILTHTRFWCSDNCSLALQIITHKIKQVIAIKLLQNLEPLYKYIQIQIILKGSQRSILYVYIYMYIYIYTYEYIRAGRLVRRRLQRHFLTQHFSHANFFAL